MYKKSQGYLLIFLSKYTINCVIKVLKIFNDTCLIKLVENIELITNTKLIYLRIKVYFGYIFLLSAQCTFAAVPVKMY